MNVETKTFTTQGAAGAASASGHIAIDVAGLIHSVALDYTGEPATTDVTITGGSGKTILNLPNRNADGVFYPRLPAQKPDGTDSTLTEVEPVESRLNVNIAQGDPSGTVKVTVFVLP